MTNIIKTFKFRNKVLEIGKKTYIMGILNVTPDSFSDGGKFNLFEKANERANKMVMQGADIIDVGGESTRPGFTKVGVQEELDRVVPIIEFISKNFDIPISIDTTKSLVAEESIKAGAHIINDIWGLQDDVNMVKVAKKYNTGLIMMHNSKTTEYNNVIEEVKSFLENSIAVANNNGIDNNYLVVDPGIGFGKTVDQNIEILSKMEVLLALELPILLGASRKSVIGKTLDLPIEERVEGTGAVNAIGIVKGADIIRVHDVVEMKRVARMSDAIIRR